MNKMKNLDFVLLLDVYEHMLTERQIEVMKYYYWEDMSLGEISEYLSITRQAVRDCIKRSEQTLIQLEEKLGLAVKIKACKKIFSDIDSIARNMGESGSEISSLALRGKDIF